ncbi:Fc.00g042750.m01.CDS01 [Cosmosporella sp. VM-42]
MAGPDGYGPSSPVAYTPDDRWDPADMYEHYDTSPSTNVPMISGSENLVDWRRQGATFASPYRRRIPQRSSSAGVRQEKESIQEILVGITVHNDGKGFLCRTLQSIYDDVHHSRGDFPGFSSSDGWQHVVVCIIIDGMKAVDPGVLDVLASIGLYQDGLCMKNTPDGQDVLGHLLMLLVKPYNCGKLNSYRWLYNAIAGNLDPKFVMHVGVGTKMVQRVLWKFWKAFQREPSLGAACGEFGGTNFEYKVRFQLDRTFESSTGHLSLLPGAFSAYRYAGSAGAPLDDTLRGDPTWVGAHSLEPNAQSPFNLNRHLADDRAICFQIISKLETRWYLKYVSVKATTDVPTTTTDFINQRRRWLNGAFFSTLYVLIRLSLLFKSGHSWPRKILFCIPVLHSALALVLAWFLLSGFLLATFTINSIFGDPPDGTPVEGFPFGKVTPIVNAVIQIVYVTTILFQFLPALGSRPRNHRVSYVVSFAIFGIVQIYLIVNIIFLIKRIIEFRADTSGASNYAYIREFFADLGETTIIVAAFSVFGVYFLAAGLAWDAWHLLTSFAQFLFVSSSYVNIPNIYAFSNTHDVTWGKEARYEELPTQRPTDAEPTVAEQHFTGREKGLTYSLRKHRALSPP